MEISRNQKTITLIIGAAAGLLTGLAAAYLLLKQQEQSGQNLKITSKDGLKIGLNALSLVKMISETGSRK